MDLGGGGGHTTDRIVQHIWGLRYIDDLVLTRQDYDHNGDYASNRSDYTHYALSDHQFSVVAMIDDAGKLLERVDYTPNGVARHQYYNDIDGDGDVDANDNSLASNASGSTIGQSNYNVDADFDRDGDVDSNDVALAGSTYYKAALPGGWIAPASGTGSCHTIGYCGYVFNQESGYYTVRFRYYDPVWGRWIERDPAGYMDSMSLYGYGWGSPTSMMDPSGLEGLPWHHIIPQKYFEPGGLLAPFLSLRDEAFNGWWLPGSIHASIHDAEYFSELEKLLAQYDWSTLTEAEARRALMAIIEEMKGSKFWKRKLFRFGKEALVPYLKDKAFFAERNKILHKLIKAGKLAFIAIGAFVISYDAYASCPELFELFKLFEAETLRGRRDIATLRAQDIADKVREFGGLGTSYEWEEIVDALMREFDRRQEEKMRERQQAAECTK